MNSLSAIMYRWLLLSLVIGACVPNWRKFFSQDEQTPTYRELALDYQLAFEKQMFFDNRALTKLLQDIDKALASNTFPEQHRDEVRRWQHKIQAYQWFAHRSSALNENKTFKEKVTTLVLDRIRQQSTEVIEPSKTLLSADEFAKAQATELNHKAVNDQWSDTALAKHDKDRFFQALIAELIEMAEFSIRKYHYLYPFEKTDPRDFCGKSKECRGLSLVNPQDKFDPIWLVPFKNIFALTEQTNDAIILFNYIVTSLQRLDATKKNPLLPMFRETDLENQQVKRLYSYYDIILLNAARSGLLPIFLSKPFRKHGGEIFLNKVGFLKVRHHLLTKITAQTVKQSIIDLKEQVIKRWLELKEIADSDKLYSTKKIYQWLSNNEVAVARVVMQDLKYIGIVADLLTEYQDKSRDPMALRIIRGTLTSVEIGSVIVIFASMTPLLPAIVGAKAIIIATAANFGWVGINTTTSIIARNRYLQLEKALLTDSSQRVSDNLELLREFKLARRKAIISGAIGLPLSIPAMKYVFRDMSSGFKIFAIDMIASLAADAGGLSQMVNETEDLSDNDLLVGR